MLDINLKLIDVQITPVAVSVSVPVDILEIANMLSQMSRAAADTSVYGAIASPTRRALLDALVRGERTVSSLVEKVKVSQSAVSQQLGVLAQAGLVEERAEGRFRYYRLRAKPLGEVDHWLNRYRALMESQLDALGQVLDAMDEEPVKRKKK